MVLKILVQELKKNGLADPLKAKPRKSITMETDFETNFGIALEEALAEVFLSSKNSGNTGVWPNGVKISDSASTQGPNMEKIPEVIEIAGNSQDLSVTVEKSEEKQAVEANYSNQKHVESYAQLPVRKQYIITTMMGCDVHGKRIVYECVPPVRY